MDGTLLKRLERAFSLTIDLYESLEEKDLTKKLENLPSNSFGQQVWCMIGARESYFMAIQLGKWGGFNCSLKDIKSKESVNEKLKDTSNTIISFLAENKNQGLKEDFLFDLLEHEIQHHGQLIRIMYGNKLKFPKSWNDRYTV